MGPGNVESQHVSDCYENRSDKVIKLKLKNGRNAEASLRLDSRGHNMHHGPCS